MNIKRLQEILTLMDSVGITAVTFEPEEDGCRLRGIDKSHQVIIFHKMEGEQIVEKPMGVQSVKGLLARLNLFDIDKASATVEYNDNMAVSIQFKMGRKKAGFTFVRPASLQVPRVVPISTETDGSSSNNISIPEEYVDHLTSVVAAMAYTGDKGERYISIGVEEDNTCTISVFDGEDDSYVDSLPDVENAVEMRGNWDVPAFTLVMKNSMKFADDKVARFNLSEIGIAAFQLGDMVALVSPLSAS